MVPQEAGSDSCRQVQHGQLSCAPWCVHGVHLLPPCRTRTLTFVGTCSWACAAIETSDYTTALQHLGTALALVPCDASSAYNAACCYTCVGDLVRTLRICCLCACTRWFTTTLPPHRPMALSSWSRQRNGASQSQATLRMTLTLWACVDNPSLRRP